MDMQTKSNDTSSPTGAGAPAQNVGDNHVCEISQPTAPKPVRCSALVRRLNHKLKNFMVSCLSPCISHCLSVQKGYMIGKQLQKMRFHSELLDARKQARILWAEEQAIELQVANTSNKQT